jgi:hypothetical protein
VTATIFAADVKLEIKRSLPSRRSLALSEVDRAIANLVLAFGTDPVARWMYDDPHDHLLHIPRLFRAREELV